MELHIRKPHVRADEDRIRASILHVMERFADKLTRLDAHLRDENGAKGGIDIRCVLEARPRGLDPVTAEHLAATVDEAVSGATGKLERVLEHRMGRLHDRR